eukprot:3743668-Karenia_brevis.AAC.1
MQQEIGEPMPGTTLSSPPELAGRGTYRVQAAVTRARERHAFQQLDVRARALPSEDARRIAWLNVNGYSAAWVAAWPSVDVWLNDG